MVNTPNDRLLNEEIGWVGMVLRPGRGHRRVPLRRPHLRNHRHLRPGDGPLGSNWVSCPAIPAYHTANHDLKITTVAGGSSDPVGPTKVPLAPLRTPWRVVDRQHDALGACPATSGTQSIEVFVDLYQFWNSAGGYFYLFTNANATGGVHPRRISHANWDMPTQPQQPLIRFTAFEADGTPHSDGYETIPLYFGSGEIRRPGWSPTQTARTGCTTTPPSRRWRGDHPVEDVAESDLGRRIVRRDGHLMGRGFQRVPVLSEVQRGHHRLPWRGGDRGACRATDLGGRHRDGQHLGLGSPDTAVPHHRPRCWH